MEYVALRHTRQHTRPRYGARIGGTGVRRYCTTPDPHRTARQWQDDLATRLAASLPACRMCPDDWMMASRIDLWDEATRARIEAFQVDLSLDLLRAGQNVIVEWGLWAREERDALRNAGRRIGAQVELHYLAAAVDELWKRIVKRDLEGRWGSRSIERHELDEWARKYEPPTDEEFRTYDSHLIHESARQ
jgi:predicted kinase